MQEQFYLATTSTAASTATAAQWANLGVPDSDQVIGFELEGEATFTAGVPGAVDDPTEAELDAMLAAIVSNITVNTKGYGAFVFGSLAQIRRLTKTVHGQDTQIQPRALAASGASFVLRFSHRIPLVVPVGRESRPILEGGRGSRRHCPPGGQFRDGACTVQTTTGALGALTYGGLAGTLAFSPGQQVRVSVVTLPTRLDPRARAIPLHFQAVASQPQNRFESGIYYGCTVDTAVPDTVAQQAIDVIADDRFLLDSSRIDARNLADGAARAWRFLAGAHQYRSGPTQAPFCILLYPDPQSHEPVEANVEFRVGNNTAGGYGLGTNPLGLCWAPMVAVEAAGTEPVVSGPSAPRAPKVK